MKKSYYILSAVILLLFMFRIPLAAKPTDESFEKKVVVYKGENLLNVNFLYAGLGSNNANLLLLANNVSATGSFFRTAPAYSYAYADNLAAGIRLRYTSANAIIDNLNMNLLSDQLSFNLTNAKARVDAVGGSLFHRWYIGLDRKGNVGVIMEAALDYTWSNVNYGQEKTLYNKRGNDLRISFSPGIVLYLLPFVSIQATVGVADLGYVKIDSFNNGSWEGYYDRWTAGLRLNMFNLNFGVTFHL